jgi:hypothetical protein
MIVNQLQLSLKYWDNYFKNQVIFHFEKETIRYRAHHQKQKMVLTFKRKFKIILKPI